MVNASKVLFAVVSSASFIGGAFAVSGDATWFFPGLGACGQQNSAGDFVAALNPADFANKGSCFRNARVTYQGRSITVQIVDLCPGCGAGGIDLSQGAFQALTGNLDLGRVPVTWNFV